MVGNEHFSKQNREGVNMGRVFLTINLLFTHVYQNFNILFLLTLWLQRGGVLKTPSNFADLGDPLKVKYIEMCHGDNSYLSIY